MCWRWSGDKYINKEEKFAMICNSAAQQHSSCASSSSVPLFLISSFPLLPPQTLSGLTSLNYYYSIIYICFLLLWSVCGSMQRRRHFKHCRDTWRWQRNRFFHNACLMSEFRSPPHSHWLRCVLHALGCHANCACNQTHTHTHSIHRQT